MFLQGVQGAIILFLCSKGKVSVYITNKKVLLCECKRLSLDEGTPHHTPYPDKGWGTCPVWTWDGVPSCPDLGWGNPPSAGWCTPLDLGWGTPPPVWTWDGVPPPESVNRLKILPSLIVRTRAVNML